MSVFVDEQFFLGLEKGPIFVEEAKFGLRYIAPEVERLSPGMSVLEVGSGACILLRELARRRPDLTFTGIEPFDHGFEFLEPYVRERAIAQPNVALHYGGYESLPGTHRFDLIFLINVLEHIPDWRHFISFVRERLAPGGKCVTLCQNFAFPYEFHVGIPILWNKKYTERWFEKRIRSFEEKLNCQGFWDQLNFVSFSEVEKECKKLNLSLASRSEIVFDMIDRFSYDESFADRNKILRIPARMLARSGILKALLRSRWFERHTPYMHLEIRHG
jgi:SAM-dependent methyltransferase